MNPFYTSTSVFHNHILFLTEIYFFSNCSKPQPFLTNLAASNRQKLSYLPLQTSLGPRLLSYRMSDSLHGFTWEIRAQISVLPESSGLLSITAFVGQ